MAHADDDLDADDLPEEETPPARTSMLTIILCFLNVAAAAGFLFLLLMDYRRRAEWSHAIFMHDLKIVGLPLKEELAEGTSISRIALPKQRLDPAQIKEAAGRRGAKSVTEPYQNLTEAFQYKILPQHLTPEVLKDHFQAAGTPVKTLEEEVERVKGKVLEDIAEAAKSFAEKAKTDKKQRERLERILLSLARSTDQVELVEKRLEKATPEQLDKLLVDAAERRMLVDILGPLEMLRGSKVDRSTPKADRKKLEEFTLKTDDLDVTLPKPATAVVLDHVADTELVPLKMLRDLVSRRVDAALAAKYDPAVHFGEEWADPAVVRDTIDKRKAIANLLTTIAHLRRAEEREDPKELIKHLLYPDGPERAIAVLGVYEYMLAYQQLTRAFLGMRPRVLELIAGDREGVPHMDKSGKTTQTIGGFVQNYNDELHRITILIDAIGKEQKRLAELQKQAKGHADVLATQTVKVAEASKILLDERKKIAAEQKQLEQLQQELFEAQQELATAASINLDLQRRIAEAEGLRKDKK